MAEENNLIEVPNKFVSLVPSIKNFDEVHKNLKSKI